MSQPPARTRRRVERLLRWYPKDWRTRYGEEFTELLLSEMSEQPVSWRRNVDVLWSGLIARIAEAGLGGRRLEPVEQVRRSLVTVGCAMAVFLIFGMAIWAQLTIGWQWSAPDSASTAAAMLAMTLAMLAFFALAVAAAIPVAWTLLTRAAHRAARGLVRPFLVLLVSAGVLIVGGRHFGNGWPGTGGHVWAHQGLVPGGVAAFAWASTLSVTSYWVHFGALMAFPASEIAWMLVSPIALVCAIVGAAKCVRRLELSARTLRYEARLAQIAALGMLASLVGAGIWILDGAAGPRNLFHVGAIDTGGLVVMAVALAVAGRAVQHVSGTGLARSAS
jgi:hypothetical protein